MELSPEVNVGYQSFEEKKNSSLADSASQISPLTGRCFTKITVTSVCLFSPWLHLQWFFLFSALVHWGLRVDAARWRSSLTHLLFPSFRVRAPSLCLPPLCSAVLKPNLHLTKKIILIKNVKK